MELPAPGGGRSRARTWKQKREGDSIILEEEIDPNYAPTEEEVIEYAEWLGMDVAKETDLMWIAREGLIAPLPPDWKPCKTVDTEEIYYFNFTSGESIWDHPCDEHYRKLYEQRKGGRTNSLMADIAGFQKKVKRGEGKEGDDECPFTGGNEDEEEGDEDDDDDDDVEETDGAPKDGATDSVVLEEVQDPNYEPSAEEIASYAEEVLGMDPVADKRLLWIARAAIKEPLPAAWKPCRTKDTNEVYYFNFSSGESIWTHPCDDHFKSLYKKHKNGSDTSLNDAEGKEGESFDECPFGAGSPVKASISGTDLSLSESGERGALSKTIIDIDDHDDPAYNASADAAEIAAAAVVDATIAWRALISQLLRALEGRFELAEPLSREEGKEGEGKEGESEKLSTSQIQRILTDVDADADGWIDERELKAAVKRLGVFDESCAAVGLFFQMLPKQRNSTKREEGKEGEGKEDEGKEGEGKDDDKGDQLERVSTARVLEYVRGEWRKGSTVMVHQQAEQSAEGQDSAAVMLDGVVDCDHHDGTFDVSYNETKYSHLEVNGISAHQVDMVGRYFFQPAITHNERPVYRKMMYDLEGAELPYFMYHISTKANGGMWAVGPKVGGKYISLKCDHEHARTPYAATSTWKVYTGNKAHGTVYDKKKWVPMLDVAVCRSAAGFKERAVEARRVRLVSNEQVASAFLAAASIAAQAAAHAGEEAARAAESWNGQVLAPLCQLREAGRHKCTLGPGVRAEMESALARADANSDGLLLESEFEAFIKSELSEWVDMPSPVPDLVMKTFAPPIRALAPGERKEKDGGPTIECTKLLNYICGVWNISEPLFVALEGQEGQWREHQCELSAEGIRFRRLRKGQIDPDVKPEVHKFASFDVNLEVLPDEGRRSRHSKLFPFFVDIQTSDEASSSFAGSHGRGHGKRLLLAARTGEQMWRWCMAIRRRFVGPVDDEEAMRLREQLCVATWTHSTDEQALTSEIQELLLKGARIDIENIEDFSALEMADRMAGKDNAIKAEEMHFSLLDRVCLSHATKAAELTLSRGADPNYVGGGTGLTALLSTCAAKYNPNRSDLADILLKRGASAKAVYSQAAYGAEWSTLGFLLGQNAEGAVVEADKNLARTLIAGGAGEEANKTAGEMIEEARAKEGMTSATTKVIEMAKVWMTALPKKIGCLNSITTINLEHNNLTVLPESFWTLRKLESVNLNNNLLFALSPSIKNLSKLKKLLLSSNKLEKLPVQLLEAPDLDSLDVDDNPLTFPPQSICRKGLESIKLFLADGARSGTAENRRVMAVVLGGSENGKTSLLNCLKSGTSRLQRRGDRTIGIEMRTLDINTSDGKQAEVNFVDFAGQKEYQVTHHFFLNERALFFIVVDLSRFSADSFDEQVMDWLRTVSQSVCGGCVIIVGTKIDLLPPEQVKHKCDMIMEMIRKAEKTELDHLKSQITAAERRLDVLEVQQNLGVGLGLGGLGAGGVRGSPTAGVNAASGSGGGAVDESVDARMAEVRDQIVELKELASHRLKLPSSVIPVSSADGLQGIAALVDTLGRLLGDGQSLSMIGEHIPTTYDTLCNLVYSLRDQSPDMTWAQFMELGSQAGMADEEELLRATEFLHDLGIVWHKRDDDMLRETVFLSLTWLNDVLKAIWRHDHEEALTFEAVTDPNGVAEGTAEVGESTEADAAGMDLATFTRDKHSFLHTGVLSVALLDKLWAHLQLTDRTMATLICMLERFGLVVMLNADRKRPARMLVPSFLGQQLSARHWTKRCPLATVSAKRWLLFGSNFCPNGLIQRVQVELYPLASGYHFTSDGGVFKVGASKLLVKLLDWKGRKGLQLEIRAPKGQRTERKMWWQLAKVEEAVQTVMRRWRGLLVTPMVPWSVADSAGAAGRGAGEAKSAEDEKVVLLSFEELLDARRWGKHEMKVPAAGDSLSIGELPDVVPLEKVLGPADIGEELARAKAKERRRERRRKGEKKKAKKEAGAQKKAAASSNQVPSTANSPESSQPATQREAEVTQEQALEKQWETAKSSGDASAVAYGGGDDDDDELYDFDFSSQKRKLLDARSIDVAVEEAEHVEQTRRQVEERREWEEEHKRALLDSVRAARTGGELDDPAKVPGEPLETNGNMSALGNGQDGYGEMDAVSHDLVIKAEVVGEKPGEDGVVQPVTQKKVRVNSDCSLSGLKRKLHKKLGSKNQKASKMGLVYRDEDGDKVAIDSELLWQEAAQMACSTSAYSLRVEVYY
jgi:centrosomal protein CEP164